MTLSSSMNAGVAGLNANTTRLAATSDNIANSGTYGYRRVQADFHSMVGSSGGGTYSAGGVRATTTRLIGESGALISTGNSTDLAVNGRGMLPVTSGIAVDGNASPLPFMMTTTGAFRTDSNGYLRTESGLVLMGWPANADGSIPSFGRESSTSLRPVNVNTNQFVNSPTTQIEMELNLPATATRAGATGEPLEFLIEYYSNLGTTENLEFSLVPTVPGAGASNEWSLTVTDPNAGGAVVGNFTLQFGDAANDGGTLVSVDPAGSYDPATGAVQITVDGNTVDLVIGPTPTNGGLTQLSDSFAMISMDRNGSPAGNLVSVEVDPQGMVIGYYDNGHSKTIYQVPLVDVPNPNGLTTMQGQTYRPSIDSGPFYLWDAGDGPTGSIAGFTREESTTDVAAELTQMIRTQRAYSSNAKVIQTVDEMLQETTNIKR